MLKKILYVKLQIDAVKLETLLNDGWHIDIFVPTQDFIVYHLEKKK
jgi:hypothetical protein